MNLKIDGIFNEYFFKEFEFGGNTILYCRKAIMSCETVVSKIKGKEKRETELNRLFCLLFERDSLCAVGFFIRA